MTEFWLPVPGYEETYRVSSLGRVHSITREGARGGMLKPAMGARYPHVELSQDGKKLTWAVHALVLLAFVGPCPDGLETRHLDGDSSNPALDNLAYGTRKENSLDKIRHGTDSQLNKTHCPQGHPYDEANTYVRPPTRKRPGRSRDCRECHRASGRAWYAARKELAS